MEEFEYRGEWWIPDEDSDEWIPSDASDRTAGVLEFNPDDGATLDLIGDLLPLETEPQRVDTIHGRITEGKTVTLRDCLIHPGGIATGTATMRNQEVHATFVFTDGLFLGEEPEFERLRVHYPLLEMWTQSSIMSRIESTNSDYSGAAYDQFEPRSVSVDDVDIKLSLSPAGSQRSWRSITIGQKALITIIPDDTLPFSEYLNKYLRTLQNFLCLAADEAVHPDEITGVSTTKDGEEATTDISYQTSHFSPTTDLKHKYDFMFSLSDISFEEAIPNWFESAENAQTLHNLYFGTRYNNGMFVSNQFLSYAIAIEAYHSYLFPEYRLMGKYDYRYLKEDILETIPDESPVRSRIEGLLNSIGFQPSLGDKIAMVFEEHAEVLREIVNIDKVKKKTTNGRHSLAHGLGREHNRKEMRELTRKLQAIIEIFLLKSIELDDSYVIRTILGNREYYLGDAIPRRRLLLGARHAFLLKEEMEEREKS